MPWTTLPPLRRGVIEAKRFGVILTSRGRRVGRHDTVTPIESSKNDQIAASTLSHVGSSVSAATLRVRRRRIEIMQPLWFIS